MSAVHRRDFLKSTAAGGLSIVASGGMVSAVARSAGTVNPSIPDTRVVNVTDSRMVTGQYSTDPATQFSRIDGARVRANMDELAKALTGKNTPAEAWATIFQKPASKQWSAVTVAIKVNCINSAMYVKPQIIGKVCEELIRLGVQPSNISLFDGGNATNEATAYNSFIGTHIPTGVKTLNKSSSQQVRNSRDIMVNCAINKGHPNENAGNVTLCMKNHVGTYKFSCPGSYDEVVNWSRQAMAGTPPMQQLCIIDSLFASCSGPGGERSHQPNSISMGTHPAVVDVLVTRYIRKNVMGCSENTSAMDYFLQAFNIERADCQWLEVQPATPVVSPLTASDSWSGDRIRIRYVPSRVPELVIEYDEPHTCTVVAADGRVIMSGSAGGSTAYRLVERLRFGNYIVSIRDVLGHVYRQSLTISR